VEAQIGWISFVQYYMDHLWEKHRHWTHSELADHPSSFFQRQVWATFMEDPVGFADKMNSMPKYVVSATLRDEDATWENSTVIRGDVVREVAALKARLEGDLLVAGSAALVQTLVEHRLVDEMRLMIFPIVLGSGKRLFGEVSEPPTMVLDNVQTVGQGIVILTYRSADAEATSGPAAA